MPDERKQEEHHEALFVQLVWSLHSAAMQQMDKVPNPLTNKVERNLEQARMSIDMLDMLKSKSRGNLKDEERQLLEQLISQCKMNFVDEMTKDEKAAEKPEPKEAPADEADKSEQATEEALKAEEKEKPEAASAAPGEQEAGENKEEESKDGGEEK